MPRFERMSVSEFVHPKAANARVDRKLYVEALKASDAGRIKLSTEDKASTIHKRIKDAANDLGIKIRLTWEDGKAQRILMWRKSG